MYRCLAVSIETKQLTIVHSSLPAIQNTTDMEMVKGVDGIQRYIDAGSTVLFDISAAYETVIYNILLRELK